MMKNPHRMTAYPSGGFILRWIALIAVMSLGHGCATYSVTQNDKREAFDTSSGYSITQRADQGTAPDDDLVVLLAFSGGGTRAAALSYGVLAALRDTPVTVNGREKRLLDEINVISAVSGGSITAAYYGLNSERIFTDFPEVFLKKDFESDLVSKLINPLQWLGQDGRTEYLIRQFDAELFHGATFSDLAKVDGPLILINASDLGKGVRLSFTQEFFDLLCTDLATFPVARAVAASVAVPVLLNPVVVRNHSGCIQSTHEWLEATESRLAGDPEKDLVIEGLRTYADKEKRPFIHLVDGGITDNLGLRAISDTIDLVGGAAALHEQINSIPARHVAVISVDASTNFAYTMDASNREPGLEETVNAMTDAQLHRYNAATLKSFNADLARWAAELSTGDHTVTPHFIRISFDDIHDPKERAFLNAIPTAFALDADQVDQLIAVGARLLKQNPELQRLLQEFK